MKPRNRKPLVTSDTPLAAYLSVSGIKLIKLDKEQSPVEFVFSGDDERLGEFLLAWDSGNAQGNCKAFYQTYRNFVRRIKEPYNG